MNKKLLHIFLILSAFGIDQFTKYWTEHHLVAHTPYPLTSWLQVYLTHNSGAAFSLFSHSNSWKLSLFLITAVMMLIFLAYEYTKTSSLLKTSAIILLSGGVLGNLYDRLTTSYVIDFISIHYNSWYFAVFNFADTWISLGCLLWLIDSYLHPSKPTTHPHQRCSQN
jgi:signal peptidase II